jgi:hypothetical protein
LGQQERGSALAHIELDLIRESDSSESSVVRVSGSCTVDGHEQRQFVGWAELFALLEKSVTAPERK